MEENNELINNPAVEYTDDNIRHLSDMEHVRTRPGMYIGKLGDGSHEIGRASCRERVYRLV